LVCASKRGIRKLPMLDNKWGLSVVQSNKKKRIEKLSITVSTEEGL